MEKILFTRKDLASSVELPADVSKVLSFIAEWGSDDFDLALWFDDTYVMIYQTKYGLWTLYEATMFKSELIGTGIVFEHCDFVFSSEKIHCPSCDYEEHVVALCIRRACIK